MNPLARARGHRSLRGSSRLPGARAFSHKGGPFSPSTRMSSNQCTLGQSVSVAGSSLHTGGNVVLTLHPAPPGHGRKFKRTDMAEETLIEAKIENVKTVERSTTI